MIEIELPVGFKVKLVKGAHEPEGCTSGAVSVEKDENDDDELLFHSSDA